MNIGRATDVGCVREINEDTVVAEAVSPPAANPDGLIAVLLVADGMGGHQAGEVASGLAGEMTRQAFLSPHTVADEMVTGGPEAGAEARLAQRAVAVTRSINQAVFGYGGQGVAHPGTTLTLCLCRTRDYTIAHVGDSRAYLLTRSGICQLTDDDSWVGEAVRRGTMTPDEARNSNLRNQLTKSIGIAADVEPSLYQGAWEPGDALLLCSDGLSEYVMPEEMRDEFVAAPDLQTACDNLVKLARERGGHDNISLVAACEGRPQTIARKPPTWKGKEFPPAALPNRETASGVHDPNRALRPMLLTVSGLAFFIIGLAVARLRYPAITQTNAITPISAVHAPAKTVPQSKKMPVFGPPAPEQGKEEPRPPGSASAHPRRGTDTEDQPDAQRRAAKLQKADMR